MRRFFLKPFIFLLVIFFISIIYLTYFGITTDKFDDLIIKKTNEVNQNLKLKFKKTKIHLNPIELDLIVKLQNPYILIRSNKIDLSNFTFFVSLKSFFGSDFLLKKAEIAFAKNDIKDLTKITNIFVPKIMNKKIKKIFDKGILEGKFTIPFKRDGTIGEKYKFSAKVIDATINLTKEFRIENLTAEITHSKNDIKDLFDVLISKGSIYDINLKDSTINIKHENQEIKIKSLLKTKGKFKFSQIKKISTLFGFKTNNFIDINGTGDIKTDISFKLGRKLKLKNLDYYVEGNIPYLQIVTKRSQNIITYLPNFNEKIILKDSDIKLINTKYNNAIELNGFIKLNNEFNSIKLKETYNYNKKDFNINAIVDLSDTTVNISKLNYIKNQGEKSKMTFDLNFIPNKFYNINQLNLTSGKTKIYLSNIKLDKNFQVNDFKELKIKTFKKGFKNNDFSAKKNKKITFLGEIFDAQPLLKSLYKKSDKEILSKNVTSEIKINFKKTITGTNDDVNDLSMIGSINKGSYDKLSLKGNFSENEIIEMSIYQINNKQKTLQIISDRARPFIKNFDFIEGFEGGKLNYESIITKEFSNSNLVITDFKVSRVPALAKLLTLASLQGIADTLTGEGIRFDSFEMKSNSKNNILNIEDALAMGPAISILLEGYVNKGNLVSLRGTLVPATKLNSIIASIPIIGDILVGKKSGEGVVGVSFKMKGTPKDIKTTINPIKTLTPRFIVRAIENMKKKKK